uniref:Protein TIC 214 n=1 Tax=Lomariopsis japurensis TaxID=373558 RepID=A0A5B9RLK5_9MONI|nr:conserved hypothetical chloroplast protein ycf1 [Lomariopsis japurensis]QEG57495.1 conserved hypothetical chloroplast protein ycf1 [Lomariopsis japurensis]
MNIKILTTLSSTGLDLMSPYILFGLYYGFLATLPVGPSQILCIRAFLLGGNISGLVSLSGSMLAQLVTISSIYCSPIYIWLSKPHLLTIVVIPYMVIVCLTINDLPNYQTLRPTTSLRDPRVIWLFLNSFLIQILNPFLLPNPVLTRLTHLFFFRYSNNLLFVITTLLGWLTGQVAFSYLSKLLLTRVKKDSPILFLLVKRSLYTTFSIVFVINTLIYLGRAPVSLWTAKFINESHDKEMSFWELDEYPDLLWWLFKPWPTSFFDPLRENRGNRFIRKGQSDINSGFYKEKTSTYFFDKCLTDGKQRLCITALPSLSIFERQLEKYLIKSQNILGVYCSYRDWTLQNLIRSKNSQIELLDRIKLLNTGFPFSQAIEKRTRLIRGDRERIPRVYDPLFNNLRTRIPVPQTFSTGDELDLTRWNSNHLKVKKRVRRRRRRRSGAITKRNSIEKWISARNQELEQGGGNPMPWETLPVRARRIFQFMFKDRLLYDYDIEKILIRLKSPSEYVVTWEDIINLDPEDQALFLTYVTKDNICYKFDQIFLSNRFLISSQGHPINIKRGIHTPYNIEDLITNLARNNELYFDTEFDFPGADGDIRHRKLRNVGFTFARGKSRSPKLVKRYARISDFRRRFLKGSMRSRRRKTSPWKALQEKVRSAFFIRLMEIPVLLQLPAEQLTSSKTKELFTDSKRIKDYQLGQQLNSLSPAKRDLSQSKLARSALAARSDIGPIHNGRGYMLVFQSKFRKFIKLPVLIMFKTIGRILLRQNSEWNKDWTKWKKEIHINCTFDGEEFSQDQLPPRWLREGIQIKIVYPFRLKPWHSTGKKKSLTSPKRSMRINSIGSQKSRNKRRLKQKRSRFTYLTALGYQTDIPFGSIQKQPSFWRPVRKKIIRTCREGFSLRTKQAYRFLDSNFNLGKMLKPSLILLKEFNLFLNKTVGISKAGEVSAEFVSTSNTQIRPVFNNKISEIVELNSTFEKKNEESINNVGEVQSISPVGNVNKEMDTISERLITQRLISQKVGDDNYVTGLSNSFNQKVNVNKPYTETTQIDELILNYRLKDIDLTNLERFGEEELTNLQEIILKLHIIITEAFERFILITSSSSQKVNRDLRYYSSELATLHTQLIEVFNTIIQETDLFLFRSEERVSQFDRTQWLSQAYLYNTIWDLSVKGNLRLNLLTTGNHSTSKRKIIRNNELWNGNLTPYQPEQPLVHLGDSSKVFLEYDSITSSPSETSSYTDISSDDTTNKSAKKRFNEHVLKYVEEWGFLNKLCDLNTSNWNKWLDCFPNCKLPLTLWCDVAPYRWRINFDCLDNLDNIQERIGNEQEYSIFQNESHNYSIYFKEPFLRDRIRNLNKLRKYRYLLQNLINFVRDGDIQKLSIWQDAVTQKLKYKDRILKITKLGRKRMDASLNSCISDSEIKFNSKFDLMPWLVTDFTRTKSPFKKEISKSKDLILRDTTMYGTALDIISRFQKVSDDLYGIILDEREDMDYLFRWKWKSETKLENLRSLTALIGMLGDDHDLVPLCVNTNVDSNFLDLYLNKTTKGDLFDDLSILSAHRLSVLLDDQNLIYKILNPFLKFKSRLKDKVGKRLYNKIYSDSYISNLLGIAAGVSKKQSHIYNIEDLLLARRRREFRFLRSLLNSGFDKPGTHDFNSKIEFISRIKWTRSKERYKPSELREVQRIKRFLWPSHRLEELACTGRFCFNILTGSRFALLRIRMYPIIRS